MKNAMRLILAGMLCTMRSLQKFTAVHSVVYNHFNLR